MAQTRRELEITLDQILIPVTGAGRVATTSHLLMAELLWPRTGVPRRSASQPCSLVKGQADCDILNWGRRILFKEQVVGRFAIRLTLTEALEDEAIEKMLRIMTGMALTVGAELAERLLLPPLGRIAAAPVTAFSKDLARYPGPAPLAEGLAELDAADFPLSGGERRLILRMTAARRLARPVKRTAGGRSDITRKTLLAQGAANGEIALRIRSL